MAVTKKGIRHESRHRYQRIGGTGTLGRGGPLGPLGSGRFGGTARFRFPVRAGAPFHRLFDVATPLAAIELLRRKNQED